MTIKDNPDLVNSDEEYSNPFTAGIPVEVEISEPWKKKRYSCTGGFRIEKNFDLSYLRISTGD